MSRAGLISFIYLGTYPFQGKSLLFASMNDYFQERGKDKNTTTQELNLCFKSDAQNTEGDIWLR